MSREIFTKILLDFDFQLNKKVILILDNFSGHKFNESVGLKNVIPCYLPPNTTSKTQPLDAGIICNFKIKYRKYMVTYSLGKMLERNFRPNEINLKLVFPWIKQALDEIKNLTILKCFQNTLPIPVFLKNTQENVEQNDDIHQLQQSIEEFLACPVAIDKVLRYAYLQEVEYIEEDVFISDSETKTITIPDQNSVLKQIDGVIDYFSSIGIQTKSKF